jgi:Domain of unknown function (DUF4259)
MGSWGSGNFQNDPALDFFADLNESADGTPLRNELKGIIDHGGTKEPSRFGRLMGRHPDRLSIHDCQRAIAAAEIVAGLCGRPTGKPPESVASWISAHRASFSEELVHFARAAIALIKVDSELRDEYDPAEWHEKMDDLELRLGTK